MNSMLTLLGISDEAAELDGYGPIPAESARELAADQPIWYLLLTDPTTGVPVKLDRSCWKPTQTGNGVLRWQSSTGRTYTSHPGILT